MAADERPLEVSEPADASSSARSHDVGHNGSESGSDRGSGSCGVAEAPSSSSSSSASQRPEYLRILSAAQYGAVTAPPDEPLQILAGPGSGKTRVLVARVAWLILEHDMNPRDLVVVTFTNKAANEMRQRLHALIGQQRTSQLVLGTFHAMCARFLRQHASLVDLGNNFSICDSDQAKAAIKAILKDPAMKDQLNKRGLPDLKPELCMAEISRAKAKDFDVDAFDAWLSDIEKGRKSQTSMGGRGRPESTHVRRAVILVYKAFTAYLRKNNALDFDDLLLYGVKLFRENARVTANMRHVLVDEFQDTNTIQYSLMACMAGRGGARGAVSIVGDPDQSIYGWRSAEVGNLAKMAAEFAVWSSANQVRRVFLEENYRSTGHVLQTAMGIIECDSNRIDRGLFTSHALGPPPVCKQFSNSQMEALFVATEIKRMIAASGGMLQYDDFAILLRFNALSREVEGQLQAENVPSRMMGGARFFERKEVKDILAYLTLADNPTFTPAMERVINVPKRSIGEKSVKDILGLAEAENTRAMVIVERIAKAKKPIMGVKPGVQASLRNFVDVVRELRTMASQGKPVSAIIEKTIEKTGYENYLKKEADFDQRWENVKELINFSHIVSGSATMADQNSSPIWAESSPPPPTHSSSAVPTTQSSEIIDLRASEEPEERVKPEKKKVVGTKHDPSPSKSPDVRSAGISTSPSGSSSSEQAPNLLDGPQSADDKSPLRVFLEAATLSTDMEQDDEDGKKPKVTIATTHAAKGLEFPVVFLLSVEEGTYPFYRASGTPEEIDEEARLLYVGVTRAQAMIYLTHCQARLVNGQHMDKVLSRFVSPNADPKDVAGGTWKANSSTPTQGQVPRRKIPYLKTRPAIGQEERQAFAAVLNRPVAPEAAARSMLTGFENSDAGVRANRADQETAATSFAASSHRGSGASFFSGPASGFLHSAGFGSMFSGGARSHVSPQLSSVGFSTASHALHGQHKPGGRTSYDAEGWAVDTRAGSASRIVPYNSLSNGHQNRRPASSTTFMDPYRASKGGIAHTGVIGTAAAHAMQERPIADASRFKARNESSIKDILALVPGDDKAFKSRSHGSGGSSSTSSGSLGGSSREPIPLAGFGTGKKKRLGVGRAPAPMPEKKSKHGD